MSYQTNSQWLNRTPNRSSGHPPWLGVIVHETASPNPDNPAGTLNYNLDPDVDSSYHDLIGRDGVRYRYLDADLYVAWHAGVNTRIWVDGNQLDGGEVNANMLGIELDGPCDGTPATAAQLETTAAVLNEYGDRYGFARDSEHLIMHSKAVEPIDPKYRSDARCTTIAELVELCTDAIDPQESYERRYRVRFNRSIVRTGPSRTYPIVSYLSIGAEFFSDSAKWGEVVENSDVWIHFTSGAGFIHSSAVEQLL